eukprot:gene28105-34030_t
MWGATACQAIFSVSKTCVRFFLRIMDADMKKAEKMAPRIAVLGCGYWGSNHIRTLKSLGALFAVSDQNTDRAAGFAAEQNDVLVEKPIALTVPDAEAAVKAARDNGRIFMVGHVLRFHPAFERLLELIKAGDLGDVRYIHSHRL